MIDYMVENMKNRTNPEIYVQSNASPINENKTSSFNLESTKI